MPRVAVIFPPLELSRDFIDYPYFADLGALQAAALLRARGHDVQLLDALASPGAELVPLRGDELRIGAPLEPARIAASGPSVVIVAYTPFHRPPHRQALLAGLLMGLREALPSTPIVLADLYQSGQHVVDAPAEAILEAYPEVDLLLRYEAEGSLPALVDALCAEGRPAAARVVYGVELESLDELPPPAWDLVDLDAYWGLHERLVQDLGRHRWAFPIDGRALPMITSRGCPYRCTHCSSNPGTPAGEPKRQRRHSRESLARHLDWLVSLGARRIHLLDELANVHQRHFDALLELLRDRDLRFEIPNGVRADHVEAHHLGAMRGRLTTLSVSAESGSQRVVDEVVGKSLDLSAIHAVCERAQRAGIDTLV
ncbi:MAG: radical SAM protein, partial [Myxococcales bacterium]|nr:radical SAM protein [Myxococcales bacterium]